MQRINITPSEQGETTIDQENNANPAPNQQEEANDDRDSRSQNTVSITPREQTDNRRR